MSKLTLSLAAATLAASLGAYASVPTGAAPFQVVVPNLKSGIEFTLEGLYLQPTNSDLNYAVVTTTTGSPVVSNTAVSSLDPDYDFGFRVGLGYVFPDSGNDVQLNWTHFDQSSDASTGVGFTSGVLTIAEPFGPLVSGASVTSASDANFTYDAIDLDVGQYLSIGTRLTTRLFAGLRYAQLQNDVTNTYFLADPSATTIVSQSDVDTYNSEFTGIGPRFGVDASYNVWDCFGVVGHVSAALLVGRVEDSSSNVHVDNFSGGSSATFTSSVTTDNQTRVVPAFDAKLGFDYSWPINNDASRFSIEAGYQVTQYVDAIDRVYSGGNVVTSGIGFNGPYLNINYKM